MKRQDKNVEEFVLRHLGLFKTPPQEEMDLAESRIESRLRTATAPLAGDVELPSRRWKSNTFALVLAAAAAVVLVVFLFVPRGMEAEAAVLNGSFSVRGTTIVRVGESVKPGELVRTNDASSAIQLSDSRVETREGSEFLWERAGDGVRVRLNKGSVIVNAQPGTGRVYVQTKNAVVVGSGSVFLVVADEEGSHVGVIQGEVRVQQGATEKKLLAAEQLATNPSLETLRLAEAVVWSRNAASHLAMLLQYSRAATLDKLKEERTTFEMVSIRPSGPLPGGGTRGTPSGDGGKPVTPPPGLKLMRARTITCGGPGSEIEVTPGRFVLRGATVYRLMVLAYGLKDCSLALQAGVITNGPDWTQSDRYDVEATIPKGAPAYTRQDLNRGEAPALQRMLQTLLIDRFKLFFHPEPKDVVAYNLVVEKPGKIKLSEDQSPPEASYKGRGFVGSALPRGVMMNCMGDAIPISSLAACLQRGISGTIIDKTDLKGLYDIPRVSNPDPSVPMSSATLSTLILEQMGLKLEPVKTAGQILVIDHVTKPTENQETQ